MKNPNLVDTTASAETEAPATTIAKPRRSTLDRFRTKQAATIADVGTLLEPLPVHSIAQAKDFVRLHPNEDEYWSPELCFVVVPIKGQKNNTLHMIDEDLAVRHLPSGRIQRFRLVLATKPYDVFFLAIVPTRNVDNSWNATNIEACEQAKVRWVQASSRREENKDSYKVSFSRDPEASPQPAWPTTSLDDLVDRAFAGRMIEDETHPGLLRLIGAKLLP